VARRPAHNFPFSAIVGQETLKLALLLNAVDPRVGGVLIRGEKGTAKSTAVRALAEVLPEIDVIKDCVYGCAPSDPGSWCDDCRGRRENGALPKAKRAARVVELPVSATEDRLVGTLDFEKALKHGERSFHPGLLASANRSILYVDEVNLLDDHLVDTLLDAAAMGVNIVEREGVSFMHPARFILVGTMNPEEGEIRPQLLDRFGLCVEITAVREPEARVEIMRRRHAFEEDATAFVVQWRDAEDDIRTKIGHARLRLPGVKTPEEVMYAIADLSLRAGVDGHRADSVMARAAAALAAMEGRSESGLRDVARVAPLVLAHRLKSRPFEDVDSDTDSLRSALAKALAGGQQEGEADESGSSALPGEGQASIFEALLGQPGADAEAESLEVSLDAPLDSARRSIAGRRQQSVTEDSRGRYRRSEPARSGTAMEDVAIDATIRVAAQHTGATEPGAGMAVTVEASDVQRKVRVRKVGASIVFCLDASGSMTATKRMDAAKAAVLELLVDAYQRRDRVAVVSFRGDDAEVILSPTASVELANLRLRDLRVGGATPLAHGMMRSLDLLEGEVKRDPDAVPWMVIVTDGRANVGFNGGLGSEDAKTAAQRVRSAGVNALVIDTGAGNLPSTAARDVARAAGADYVRLPSLAGTSIAAAVRERL
jgi:magnesium chelatase subunit D